MSNGQSPEDWRRERALAALARAMRGEDESSPKSPPVADDSVIDWRRTAAERHRLARQQREAAIRAVEPPVSQEGAAEVDETGIEVTPAAPSPVLSEDAVPVALEPPAAVEEQQIEGADEAGTQAEETVETPPAPAQAEPDEKTEEKPVVLVRPGIAASRPLILRLTLLGALVGIAIALLLWNSFGAIAAFLPLAGLLLGLAAGLLAALRRPKVAVSAEVDEVDAAPSSRTTVPPAGDPPDSFFGEQAESPPLGHPPSVDEIRASLRQLRAATQDLARQRARR